MCFRGSKTIPDMSCFRSSKSLQAMSYKWNAWITKVLWLSCFLSNYQFVSFGGCFWIFGASNNPDSLLFLFSCYCQSVSCHCQQKKFLPLFFRRNTLTCVTPKEKWNMFMLFLLGLCAIHINMNKNSKLSTKGYF